MSTLLESFPPISTPDTRVLILGSMPGAESLRKREYYGHPRNAFWPIMAALFYVPELTDYDAKRALLIAHRIALWDVVCRCRRPGSLDQHIREEVPNDFPRFFTEHPGIVHIFLNGAKAYELHRRHVTAPPGMTVTRLPSTSPAYTLPFAEKLEAWKAVREALERGLSEEGAVSGSTVG